MFPCSSKHKIIEITVAITVELLLLPMCISYSIRRINVLLHYKLVHYFYIILNYIISYTSSYDDFYAAQRLDNTIFFYKTITKRIL